MYTEPVYFGSRNLFGLYRSPSSGAPVRRHLVVICNSGFHEYFKTQFVARQLNVELANLGFDVFRFDYSGQGNSGGDNDNFLWAKDLDDAVKEALAISGAVNLSLIGFRFGALIAAGYQGKVHSLAMWDPVESGKVFVEELRQVQRDLMNAHQYMSEEELKEISQNELVGYCVGNSMLKDMENFVVDWSSVSVGRACLLSSGAKSLQSIDGFSGEISYINESFDCQWSLPASRLLYAHGIVRQLVVFLK